MHSTRCADFSQYTLGTLTQGWPSKLRRKVSQFMPSLV